MACELPQLSFATHESPLGPIGLAGTTHGLSLLALRMSASAFAPWLEKRYGRAPRPDSGELDRVRLFLDRYFAGKRITFDGPFDPIEGTPFQRRVWAALLTIPYGEVRSYRWLAGVIGHPEAFRAVGAANGANPLPILIPCHRVINQNGGLGGYSGGLDVKKWLLALEEVPLAAVTPRLKPLKPLPLFSPA